MLGFAPALRFLWSQIMCRLCKRPLDETVNQSLLYVYTRKTTYKHCISCSPCQNSVDYGHTKLTHRAVKVSVFRMLKLNMVGKHRKNNQRQDLVALLLVASVASTRLFPDASLVRASARESRSATQVAPLEISDS